MRRFIAAVAVLLIGSSVFAGENDNKVIYTYRGSVKGVVEFRNGVSIERQISPWRPSDKDLEDRYHAKTDYYRAMAEYYRGLGK